MSLRLWCFIFIQYFFVSYTVAAQDTIVIEKPLGEYYSERYQVLSTDTAFKIGSYSLVYHGNEIEKGQYCNNKKCGNWAYFSFNSYYDFTYSYDDNKLVNLARHGRDYDNTPVLFKGSPVIPYVFLLSKVRYSSDAFDNNITGNVVLAIHINKEGKITSTSIKQSLYPSLDSQVLRISKTFPKSWEWIPAKAQAKNIDSEYHIVVKFELND